MPSRILRDSLVESESISACSPGAQDRFPRYLFAADDHGCFRVQPIVLAARLWPLRDDVSAEVVTNDLSEYGNLELPGGPMLIRWRQDGKVYAWFTNWTEHQRPRPSARRRTPEPPHTLQVAAVRGNLPQLAATCAMSEPHVFTANDPALQRVRGEPPQVAAGCGDLPLQYQEQEQYQLQDQSQEQEQVVRFQQASPEALALEALVGVGYAEHIDKTAAFISGLVLDYPDANVAAEIRSAAAWEADQPPSRRKRKTNRGKRMFLRNWMKRASTPFPGGASGAPRSAPPDTFERMLQRDAERDARRTAEEAELRGRREGKS